jgi:hypothetical protein
LATDVKALSEMVGVFAGLTRSDFGSVHETALGTEIYGIA